nr:pantetheine-phosphate adenylyltransferase [Mycoplasma crocodyli]
MQLNYMKAKSKKAIYAGSFDPFHKGHLELLKKSLKLFDYVYLVVSINPDKNNALNLDRRYKNVCDIVEKEKLLNVEVLLNTNDLIANVAKKYGVNFLIRSSRNENDFQYEMELAAGNKHVNNDLETVILIPDYEYIEYSSTLERHKEKLGK